MAEISKASGRMNNPRNAVRGSSVSRMALGFLQLSSNRYNNPNKITVMQTPSYNWRLYYDNKDTGVTVGRNQLNEYDLYDEGMIRMR
ncbi:MAG: hypothetical protein ACI3YI_13005 [Bacteroidaceae bacterium]